MSPRFADPRPRPLLTVDVAAFSVAGGALRVLLVRRGKDPFKGRFALPGGFVEPGEDLPDAAARELEEETGLKRVALEPFGAFGRPGRDPRGRTISGAFWCAVPFGRDAVAAGDDAAEAVWKPARRPPPLAFDHDEILAHARRRLEERVRFGDGAFLFLPPRFALAELRGVLEAVRGRRIPAETFRRAAARSGILKDAPGGLVRLCRRALARRLREGSPFG